MARARPRRNHCLLQQHASVCFENDDAEPFAIFSLDSQGACGSDYGSMHDLHTDDFLSTLEGGICFYVEIAIFDRGTG